MIQGFLPEQLEEWSYHLRGEYQELSLGSNKFEMSVNHLNGEVEEAVEYMNLQLREEVQTGRINVGTMRNVEGIQSQEA